MNDSDRIEKVREIVCKKASGNRCIVVLDRGWIFAGNLTREGDTCTLTNAVNVRTWKAVGFGGLTQGAKSAGAVLDACRDLTFHASAMIFAVPIGGDWDA